MRERQCVNVQGKIERQKFIEMLESKGYTIDDTIFSRNKIICNIFPIIVDIKNKKISMMGNITTSAAAVSCGIVMSKKEFEILMNYDFGN